MTTNIIIDVIFIIFVWKITGFYIDNTGDDDRTIFYKLGTLIVLLLATAVIEFIFKNYGSLCLDH